jgi:four helix bundle protein
MEITKTFQELLVWQKAHKLVLDIYQMTKGFPKEKLFGLTSQLRRAIVSVPANIAEGYRKNGKLDKAKFFNIAEGSLEESKYYLILANDLNYCKTENLLLNAEEVSKMLDSYRKKILSSIERSQKTEERSQNNINIRS